ncbi:hypothetical protein [Hymenobacter psychrophilus]|uniref:Uncharacterized protein n=1 Tax=Hymenobacter psychrophilus TaxID=651662 RepID=A0A1H3CWX1_9BACT|nr:hypothetical protein [Hymenobacter psychrophilus]SDX58044.1 hypothetical protein SAMN04488069_102126 [Hymenobacter psychrophilus]
MPIKKLLLGLALLLVLFWLAVRWLPRPPVVVIRRPAAVLVVRKPARTTVPKHVSLVKRPRHQ